MRVKTSKTKLLAKATVGCSHRRASVIASGLLQLNIKADMILRSSVVDSNPALCRTSSAVPMLCPLRNLGWRSSSVHETQIGSFSSLAAVLWFAAPTHVSLVGARARV